ncbi:hypothetical protein ZOD2009_05647 [Haladaptatus paucihalophilus DX253]|uniref:Uncharacterized protein n=1 Tax=Haladaptatus paucihalophilus DX253 TaxID=797209 RepID=E7QQQ9_HALPU|nr:hypothetical protein [Haladaptatus paucihalophilus]EFW93323.1 hypothetical protein ZOD2009_05647 [Haladaptatus paucihalophilus DX253]SHK51376.1 hypothetical protein SAMN05444342_1512 [Haladaptatus paucihalophilus DX253]
MSGSQLLNIEHHFLLPGGPNVQVAKRDHFWLADNVNPPVGSLPMNCQNCGHSDSFVLLLDLATRVSDAETTPLDWSFCLQCPACESTDVDGDPSKLFARL